RALETPPLPHQVALLPAIAQQLKRIVNYRILDIFLPGPDGLLHPAYVDGYEKDEAWRYTVKPGTGMVGTAAGPGEPLFVPDVSKDPRYVSFFPGVKAEMAIPLIHRE